MRKMREVPEWRGVRSLKDVPMHSIPAVEGSFKLEAPGSSDEIEGKISDRSGSE